MRYKVSQSDIISTTDNRSVNISVNPPPVILRSRNRCGVMDFTVRSMICSGTRPNLIIDDCSDDADTRRYLLTDDTFAHAVSWPNDKLWLEHVGRLPETRRLSGIRSKIRVLLKQKRIGSRASMYFAIKEGFERFRCSHIIVAEADIVVCEGWYDKLLKYRDSDAGIVNGFGKRYTSQMLMISRKLYDEAREDFDLVYDPKLMAGDKAILASCRKVGMKWLNIGDAVCQHIGYKSSAHPHRNRYIFANKLCGSLVYPNAV